MTGRNFFREADEERAARAQSSDYVDLGSGRLVHRRDRGLVAAIERAQAERDAA